MDMSIEKLFLKTLNMSITASYVILFVIVSRFFLKRAPKIYAYALWAVVLFRLVVPLTFSSVFSLLQPLSTGSRDMIHVPMNIGLMDQPQVNIGVSSMNQAINASLPVATPAASVNPIQVWLSILSAIWLLGVLAWVAYSIFSYIKLKKKVSMAIKLHDNIYECANIGSPFVLGILKPRIYLPVTLNETERIYILKHEQIHIKRLDYIIKLFAYFAICIHWFNPLVWISFMLMNRDMEMSCDEQVVYELGKDIKKAYSHSLLSMSTQRGSGTLAPLAFGESSSKIRIKNLLNYKKPPFWTSLVLIILCGIIGLGLLTNPKEEKQDLSFLKPDNLLSTIAEKDRVPVKNHGGTTYLTPSEVISWIEATDWKEKSVKSPYELSADYSIVINEEPKQEIRLYESEPRLVMINYGDKWRYYSITRDNYDDLLFKVMTKSYFEPDKVKSDEDTNQNQAIGIQVEDYLNKIMSSPKEAKMLKNITVLR